MSPPAAEPPAGEPFASEPLTPDALAAGSGRAASGCGRPALIGCGVLVVLLGLAAMVFLLKAPEIFGWLMARFEAEVTANLPDDLGGEERERLHDAFAAASEAVKSGRADALELQRMQAILSERLLEGDGAMTREQVLELIEALEAVAGTKREAPTPEGAPAEPPSEALPQGGRPSAARSAPADPGIAPPPIAAA